jgi:uncharacterized protein
VPQPVVHFEVIGKNPDGLRRYYGDLFGWTFDTPSPVAKEVSDADSYGFLELVTADDGTGIRGGIGGGGAMTATPSSTWVLRTLKPRFSGLSDSGVPA